MRRVWPRLEGQGGQSGVRFEGREEGDMERDTKERKEDLFGVIREHLKKGGEEGVVEGEQLYGRLEVEDEDPSRGQGEGQDEVGPYLREKMRVGRNSLLK